MRKILVAPLLVIALAGGYTAYWFKKSEEFKQTLTESIAALNTQAKGLSKDTDLLRYESIEVSGFPFSMTLRIAKPVVDLPLSAFLQKLPQTAPAIVPVTVNALPPLTATPAPASPTPVAAAPAPAIPAITDWVEEISYGDSVSVTGNLTGNRFTLTVSGDRTHKSLVNHALSHTLVSSSATPLVCHLTVQQTGSLPWTMQPIFTDLKTFIAVFRSADCAADGITLKDGISGATLLTSDRFSVKAGNEAAGAINRTVTLGAEVKNAKALPAIEPVAAEYKRMFYSLMATPEAQRMINVPFSEYGEQNVKIDIAYEGPTERNALTPETRIRLDINALDIKNALFSLTLASHINSAPEGSERTASVTLHSHSEATARYDQLLAKQYTQLLTAILQSKGSTGSQAAFLETLAKLGTPEEVVNAVMPQFHLLSPTDFDVNVNAKGPNNPQTFLSKGNLTLSAFNWVAAPYGIKLSGNVTAASEQKMPSGEIIATCLTCDNLVEDAGNYAMRVETLFNRASPGKTPFITKGLIDGVKQFLHGIAEPGADKNTKDIVIHAVMKDTGDFTISGKQPMELMGLYSTTILPNLAKPQMPQAPVPAPGK